MPLDFADTDGSKVKSGGTSGCLVVWSNRNAEPSVGDLAVIERVGGLADLAIKRRSDHQRLRQMVDFDQLTGALSRVGLQSTTAGSETVPRACVLFDLDDFKEVNDLYGHAVGDEVLRAAVKRVSAVMRYQDLLCRLGGDEFVILVAGGAEEHGVAVARRVLEVLIEPIRVGPVEARVGASVGVAPFDPDVPLSTLMDRADKAMFAAKRLGKNGWELWAPPRP
jgi:diguanylate cyclase (GGDEF)-like protein